MKSVIYALTIWLFLINHSFSKEIEGYCITRTDDTIRVLMDIPIIGLSNEPNFEKLQRKVKYYDVNKKKNFIWPDYNKEFGFIYNGEKIRMISVRDIFALNTLSSDTIRIFLKIVVDGPLRMFNYYETQPYGTSIASPTGTLSSGTSQTETFILQKNHGQLISFGLMSFKKNIKEYLSDCPEVVSAIEEKEYGKKDIEVIINEYNVRCGEK